MAKTRTVDQTPRATKRHGNKPWKHIYGVDRKYTARVDRAKERGQYTAPEETSK